MSNYSAPDFDPWVSNIRGLGNALARMPALRAQAQERQAMIQLREMEMGKVDAETQEANARTGLIGSTQGKTDAETADIKGLTDSGNRISDAIKVFMNNPNDHDAQVTMVSELGHNMEKNPEEATQGIARMMATIMAKTGDTNFAEQGSLQGNAASIANNLANNTRVMQTPMVVPDNSVAIDKTTGKPVATSPQKLSVGQRLFTPGADNVTLDTQPTVQGGPTPPKSSASDATRDKLKADLVKGGNSMDPSISGTNAAAGLKLYDALVPPAAAGPAPTNAPVSASAASIAPDFQAAPPGPAQPTKFVQPGGGATASAQKFDSEVSARAAGFNTGDIVYLNGVGKVRLR